MVGAQGKQCRLNTDMHIHEKRELWSKYKEVRVKEAEMHARAMR